MTTDACGAPAPVSAEAAFWKVCGTFAGAAAKVSKMLAHGTPPLPADWWAGSAKLTALGSMNGQQMAVIATAPTVRRFVVGDIRPPARQTLWSR
ncbi:hypothetical protein [Mycolicibacterium grossiae]|uniref:hypothetical protein n=1 Tax=Mycolicibacterium grossiae TaxID=1552759 RepID=UPI0014786ED3|nr:hypothetical protein [Mycolicibacterium grossiae]